MYVETYETSSKWTLLSNIYLFIAMFINAVCVLFLIELRWSRKKNMYQKLPCFCLLNQRNQKAKICFIASLKWLIRKFIASKYNFLIFLEDSPALYKLEQKQKTWFKGKKKYKNVKGVDNETSSSFQSVLNLILSLLTCCSHLNCHLICFFNIWSVHWLPFHPGGGYS